MVGASPLCPLYAVYCEMCALCYIYIRRTHLHIHIRSTHTHKHVHNTNIMSESECYSRIAAAAAAKSLFGVMIGRIYENIPCAIFVFRTIRFFSLGVFDLAVQYFVIY